MPYVVRVEAPRGTLRGYLCRKRVVRLDNATKYATPSAAQAAIDSTLVEGVLVMRDWRTECDAAQSEDAAPTKAR